MYLEGMMRGIFDPGGIREMRGDVPALECRCPGQTDYVRT